MLKVLTVVVSVVSVVSVMLFSGCGKEKSKTNIPKDMEVTKLSDVLKNPTEYNERNVLLKGTVANAHSCHIVYQEGLDSVEIYPKGFKCPKLKNGQQIKVYVEITVGEEKIIFSALKLEVVK